MTSPRNAVTLEDQRYYTLDATPGVHYPSITTVIKQGVPKPFLPAWAAKKTAELAYEQLGLITHLRKRADADS